MMMLSSAACLPRLLRSVWRQMAVLACLCVALCLLASPAWAQNSGGAKKIGIVDMQRLLDSAPQVAAAKDKLQAEFKKRDEALQNEMEHLDTLRAKLASMSAADEAAPQLRQQIQTLERSIERTRQQLRDELSKRSDQELDRAWPLIRQAVSAYARKNGYDLILPTPVVYASAQIDVTDDVLADLKRAASKTQ